MRPSVRKLINLRPQTLNSRLRASTLQALLVMNAPECLDYRTPSKKHLDSQIHRIPSPVRTSWHRLTPLQMCP
ncbi:uncharacterized protein AKAME5_000645500 [Lates japonicus]|uniref:Uncharacterized protein n=1 Tax=Lates japonicus TaxID=270547 RepID=A0AAD3MGH0_LATJO|nr:uncharacterized protein AKAME5_000645500 [Lates japonicus]